MKTLQESRWYSGTFRKLVKLQTLRSSPGYRQRKFSNLLLIPHKFPCSDNYVIYSQIKSLIFHVKIPGTKAASYTPETV